VKQQLERQAAAEAERQRREEQEKIRLAEVKRQQKEREERERLAEIHRQQLEATNAKAKAECDRIMREERERQAQAQAERLRQQEEEQARLAAIAPAPVTWEAPKTEGVSAGTELEFEVVNEREFAEWCWANGRSHWVRKIEFEKRPITEELAKVPDTSPVPQVPGLTIRRVAAVRVKKAKAQRTLNVSTTMVGL
jgi:glucosamine 6-phosphate synthetase-like amidotransferase/phosphosugar isomerase protein